MTKPEFLALPPKEQQRLLEAEFEADIRRSVWESLKEMQPIPGLKSTIGVRIHRNSPFVVHFRKHGRWFKWWVYCDGWSEARVAGKSEEMEVSILEAFEAVVGIYVRRD